MKPISIIIGLLSMVLITSCSQQTEDVLDVIDGTRPNPVIGLTEPEILSIMYGSDNELTEAESAQIASAFIMASPASRTSTLGSITLKNKEVIKASNTRTSCGLNSTSDHVTFYEYEFGGLDSSATAIVCGDKRFPSVIAYIDKYKDQAESASIMIGNAKLNALAQISQIKIYEDSLRNGTLHKIYGSNDIPQTCDFNKIADKVFLIDNQSRGGAVNPGGPQVAKIGELTSTKWNQTSPYNLYAPSTEGTNDNFGYGYDNRYPTGCLVVAMAQIAAYLKTPLPNINWNVANVSSFDIGDTSNNAREVAKVMQLIANGSGTTYGPNGGSTSTDKARDYMKKYGVYMDNTTDCTFQNMKSSLDALRLVLLTGTSRQVITRGYLSDGNHAWLVDGYQVRERYNSNSSMTRMILKQYNVYCHCNFGWGGQNDGWYLFQSNGTITFDCVKSYWDSTNIVFDYNLKAYPNVRQN